MNTEVAKSIVAEYKKAFQRVDKEERYKWEAIKCFQNNWNPDAENFEEMLKAATAKAKNLLDSRSVFPRGMILEYARNFPKETRQWFIALFDETAPLSGRIQQFIETAQQLNKKFFGEQAEKKAHYQDLHAISVYLTFRYPEKYYFYKRGMFVSVARQLGFDNIPKQGGIENLPAFFEMANALRQIILQDGELRALNQSRLGDSCYKDAGCTVLTQDIILFAQKSDSDQTEGHIIPDAWLIAAGEGAHLWDDFVSSNMVKIGWSKVGDLSPISSKKELEGVVQKAYSIYSDESDDAKSPAKAAMMLWNFSHEMKVGDIVFVKAGTSQIIGRGTIRSEYKFGEYGEYQHVRAVEWTHTGKWEAPFTCPQSALSKLSPDKCRQLEELVSHEDIQPKGKIPYALNTIFYGPPGTGKTYTLLNIIAKKYFYEKVGQLTDAERNADVVANLGWWEVISLCLLDLGNSAKVPEIMAHPLMTEHLKNTSSQSPNNAVWGQLQIHTPESCQNVNYSLTRRSEPKVFSKDQRSTWTVDRDLLAEVRPDLLERLEQYHAAPKVTEIKRYQFITFHQSYSYENFVEGICAETDEGGNIRYDVKPGTFWKFCQQALNDPEHDYTLFIDEINRGNVSGIFGELITLIESDKRGELHVILPYSKRDFFIPKNLYIFGSMNTADRSIDALDSALRRRFSFVEMVPRPELLSQPDFAPKHLHIDLCALLKALNRRVEFLLDRDHKIGHSYFMSIQAESADDELINLKTAFKDKIIPLLEDYFYGNLEKVRMVLGEKFIVPEEANGELTSDCLMYGEDAVDFQDKTSLKVADIFELNEEDFNTLIK